MDFYNRPYEDFDGTTPLPNGFDFDPEFYVEVVNSAGELLDCSTRGYCEI